ncbi:hypothetical protein Tco_1104690 [Tanacetum coccineum]
MLEVLPWKGVVRFGKRGKLNPSRVHNTFHESNLKKCVSDDSLVIPLEELRVDDKLYFVEEPIEVMDLEIKQLKRSRIPIIKVRWNSKRATNFADVQAFLLSEDELDKESDEEKVLTAGEDMDEDPQVSEDVRTPSPKQDQPEPSHVQESTSDSTRRCHEFSSVGSLRNNKNNIKKQQSPMLTSRPPLKNTMMKMLLTELLKDINNDVKDDPATNKKLDEAIETFAKISTNTTEVLSLVKDFDFSTLQSTMKDLQAHALKQEEVSAAWTKSSTNMARNLGSRMTAIEISQTGLKRKVSSLRQDTSEIKSMMTESYQAFKCQSSLAPSSSVTPTLALTNIPANFEGENATNTATEEPLFHTEGETKDPKMAIPISSI